MGQLAGGTREPGDRTESAPGTPQVIRAEVVRRWRRLIPWRDIGELLVQAGIMIGLISVYRFGRHIVEGNVREAMAHATSVWHIERWLHLPSEASIQQWALTWLPWVHLANRYYVYVHFPLTGLFLAWVWFRRRDGWARVRLAMIVSTGLALAIQIAYPLAPPRLDPGLHMTDTMLVYGPSAYQDAVGQGFANQLAAMPSLHVGWSILVAWGVVHYGRGRLRWLVIAHPLVTVSVVTLTANHYWLDSIVGASLVAVAIAFGAFRENVGRQSGWTGGSAQPQPVTHSSYSSSMATRTWAAEQAALRIR